MQDTDIRIGNVYDIKVGKNLVAVRIMRLAEKDGWEAVSLKNNNPVIIRTAERIVGPHNPKLGKQESQLTEALKTAADTVDKPKQKPKSPDAPKKVSGLDAAAQVLAEAKTPLNCTDLVRKMFNKGLWISNGNTPVATIYSAIIREIKVKGDASRFRKTAKGLFELAQ